MNENQLPQNQNPTFANPNPNPNPNPAPIASGNQPDFTRFQNPNPAATQNDIFNKLPLIIGISIAATIAIVAGVAAFVLLNPFGGPNYGESYNFAYDLHDQYDKKLSDYDGACYAMSQKLDEATSVSAYKETVENCKKDISAFRDLADKLKSSSGIAKNSDLKAKFDEFEKSMNAALPTKQNLDKMGQFFLALYDFTALTQKLDDDISESQVKEAVAILSNSGDDELANFGREWGRLMTDFLRAGAEYSKISYSSPNYREVYNQYSDAQKALRDYVNNVDFDKFKGGGFDEKALSQDLYDATRNLKTAVTTAYEAHYDGKNTDRCDKLSDGTAICD